MPAPPIAPADVQPAVPPEAVVDSVVSQEGPLEDEADLAPSVRAHEPAGALFAGAEGLDDFRVLILQLPKLLTPQGVALVEIGSGQAEAVTALAASAGMSAMLHHDLAGRPRALEMRAKPKKSLGNAGAAA